VALRVFVAFRSIIVLALVAVFVDCGQGGWTVEDELYGATILARDGDTRVDVVFELGAQTVAGVRRFNRGQPAGTEPAAAVDCGLVFVHEGMHVVRGSVTGGSGDQAMVGGQCALQDLTHVCAAEGTCSLTATWVVERQQPPNQADVSWRAWIRVRGSGAKPTDNGLTVY
jgi:hypothetical protein